MFFKLTGKLRLRVRCLLQELELRQSELEKQVQEVAKQGGQEKQGQSQNLPQLELLNELKQAILLLGSGLANSDDDVIAFATVQLVCRVAEKLDIPFSLKEFLRDSYITSPSVAVQESKEIQNRREYLRLRQQQKEYNQMVHGNDTDPTTEGNTGENPMLLMRNQISVSTNIVVSIFVMFGIGYYAGGTISTSENTKMTCGLAASTLVLLVEMLLFILRAVRMENTYEKQKRPTGIVQQQQQRTKLKNM